MRQRAYGFGDALMPRRRADIPVLPAVIAAHKTPALTGLFRDKWAAAMSAGVVEGAQFTLQITYDQNGRPGIAR